MSWSYIEVLPANGVTVEVRDEAVWVGIEKPALRFLVGSSEDAMELRDSLLRAAEHLSKRTGDGGES